MRSTRPFLLLLGLALLPGCGGAAFLLAQIAPPDPDPPGEVDDAGAADDDAGAITDDAGPVAPDGPPTGDLAVWLVAEDAVAAAGTGVVASVTSRAPGALVFGQQVSASSPTVATSALAGEDALVFDGEDYLTAANAVSLTDATLFFVVDRSAGAADARMALLSGCPAGGTLALGASASTLAIRWDDSAGGGDLSVPLATEVKGWHLVAIDLDDASFRVFVDGALEANAPVAASSSPRFSFLDVGAECGMNGLVGSIAELLVYDAKLDDAARAAVTAYLTGRYGTPD